jgi:UPF0716 family protein affecting phage T7 exclusion
MTGSSIAGIITAVATVLIAVGGLITSFTVLLPILRGTRDNHRQIVEVHTMVNQQRTDSLIRQEQLMQALIAAGVAVPRDTSLQAPGGGPAQP